MALPFGLGIAVSVGLYKLQNDPNVPFSSFMLFLGVALAITAFPVLARILAELKLLRTNVGALTMASGLLNDCTAWVLLALVVALLNSSNGLQVLYVLLTTVAFSLFLFLVIRPLYRRLAIYTGSIQHGPTPLLMTVTLVMVMVSAFVTDIIGVHAIFGGFLAGTIVPHDGDLATKIAEKIEDIVNIIFLPLYFTLSGLKTQIGLLNTGIVWGYVILVIVLACFGKIIGCTAAAKLCGMTVRESFTVGFLMNCKGLVELIVLNIGHNAGVLNDQVFVIMVVMALITTFMTTPVVIKLYPEWYQKMRAEVMRGVQGGGDSDGSGGGVEVLSAKVSTIGGLAVQPRYCLVTMLNELEMVPPTMAVIRLLNDEREKREALELHTLRLLELTDRATDIMKIRDQRETLRNDPVLNVIRTFAPLIGVDDLQTRLEFLARHEFVKVVSDHGECHAADMILLPWSVVQTDAEDPFLQDVIAAPRTPVGLLLDRGLGTPKDDDESDARVVVPFAGGPDDREALLFALRLHQARQVTVLHLRTRSCSLPAYASPSSIHYTLANPAKDTDALLTKLFVTASKESNVEYASAQEQGPLQTNFSTHDAVKSLRKHDLVIVGRQTGISLGSVRRFDYLRASVVVVKAAVAAVATGESSSGSNMASDA
ncbi:Sodium/hydrogen exchanger family-domain-containing protein [Dichotomocladium elegans]|nr:Sodium/hydrogen exchanger family-domain-containing protein [Dichotomocladium elegans]